VRRHSIALVAVIALVTLGGSVLAVAQTANRTSAIKVYGYQDSRGTFHPLANLVEPDATATTTTFAGTIETTVTITLKTALPKGGTIACRVEADGVSSSETGALGYDESATALATVSGSTATCKVNIPFSWLMFAAATGTTNSITGSLDVTMYSPITTSIAGVLEDLAREHDQAITINGGKVADGTLAVTATVTL
jgi:hypothetical protein